MTLKDVLKSEAEHMYEVTKGLFDLVDPDQLDWKPGTGSNWMTTGQLMHHCATACGSMFKGFVSGDWDFPADMEMPADDAGSMLPPADAMPRPVGIDEVLRLLEEDRRTAMKYVVEVDERDLLTKSFEPPWGGHEATLFQHLLMSIWHLGQHKGQLFYYLKLQGKPVDTQSLWGM